MRVRTVLTALAGAALLTGFAAPASAGTGSSTVCSNGSGAYREIPILTSPVTVAIEVVYPPGGPAQYLNICYSTAAVGQPGTVTGGVIALDVQTDTGTAYPRAYVGLGCYPDFASGVGPACGFGNSANVARGDVSVTTPSSSICIVSLGSGCVAFVPGVKVATGQDTRPLLAIQLLGVPLPPVDMPAQCVAVVVTCP